MMVLAGGPWLPNSWLDESGIRHSLNVLARRNGVYLLEYGHPFGYLPLREHLSLSLTGIGVSAHAGQILLTQGTSQALEIIIRALLKPGDAALVDDPGYYNLFGNLRLNGIRMLSVPRNTEGPDVASLEEFAAAHKPKVFFTQSAMQNPTGTTFSPHVAFKVLQAAERYNFMVVEDDIFCDLQVKTNPRLATTHIPRSISRLGTAYGVAGVSHSRSFDHLFRPETLRTAMATAFFCPAITTSRLPRVSPV